MEAEIKKRVKDAIEKYGLDFLWINDLITPTTHRNPDGTEEIHVILPPRSKHFTEEQEKKIDLAPVARHDDGYCTLILKDGPDLRYQWEASLEWQGNDKNRKPSGVYEIWTRNILREKDIILLKSGVYYIVCYPIRKIGESLTEPCRIGQYLRRR